MKQTLSLISCVAVAILASLGALFRGMLFGPPTFRARTCDVAFGYRMGVGFPGDINRMHPASVVAGLIDSANPFRAFGEAALFGAANNYRTVIATDQSATAVRIAGIIVRSYPTQQTTGGMNASFGNAVPPASGVADFLDEGFAIVKMKAGVVVKKGDPVFIWATATETVNIQGEYQATATASKTVPVANAYFNGPADAQGNVEIRVFR
jgi:hypothetical protein